MPYLCGRVEKSGKPLRQRCPIDVTFRSHAFWRTIGRELIVRPLRLACVESPDPGVGQFFHGFVASLQAAFLPTKKLRQHRPNNRPELSKPKSNKERKISLLFLTINLSM
jgi:hypothetical protein